MCMGRKPKKAQKPRHFFREWRIHSGLSLEAVAERLQTMAADRTPSDADRRAFKRLGVTHGNLSRIERGLVPYNQTLLELLAEIYRTDPASLIMRDPSKTDFLWSIWETLKPAERAQAVEVIKVLKKTGTS
jgi:transcriptional regulator with XRE-family HTH domain